MSPKKRARILEKIRSGRANRTERLILKQEGLCFYCWTDLDKDVTKEHLQAKANEGSNDVVNLRVAHGLCNGVVGTLPVDIKLELHEIGRDKGADAFWQAAREYQRKLGDDKNAYRRVKGPPKNVQNARAAPDETREVRPQDVQRELDKLQLGQPPLNRYEREEYLRLEVERRKQEGHTQLGLIGWMRLMEQQGWLAPPRHVVNTAQKAA